MFGQNASSTVWQNRIKQDISYGLVSQSLGAFTPAPASSANLQTPQKQRETGFQLSKRAFKSHHKSLHPSSHDNCQSTTPHTAARKPHHGYGSRYGFNEFGPLHVCSNRKPSV